ncbi:MAG: hypothetical protein AB8B97_10990 [Granulosicoccus sp.]
MGLLNFGMKIYQTLAFETSVNIQDGVAGPTQTILKYRKRTDTSNTMKNRSLQLLAGIIHEATMRASGMVGAVRPACSPPVTQSMIER